MNAIRLSWLSDSPSVNTILDFVGFFWREASDDFDDAESTAEAGLFARLEVPPGICRDPLIPRTATPWAPFAIAERKNARAFVINVVMMPIANRIAHQNTFIHPNFSTLRSL